MQGRYTVFFVLLLCTAVLIAGCTGTTGPAQTSGSPSAGGASTGSNLVPSPTDVVPENNAVSVTVKEKEYNGKIAVVFDGGKGQNLVSSIDVTLYRSDGTTETAKIGKNKGDQVEFVGTKDPNNPDRVVVYVSEMNGQTYKVTDVISEYRQH
ncbi:hypothetical protein [Methanoregula formicica]|uniref:Uncharacterized protein n=1 Tax=Methanoregula formicica (strain DSM 22288 / NBRC 105244 / SMSP) TaxID=593750 RepID=L0HFJ3_METFS|nr:hypothetical protein [Methanoregula formicica]AGB02566.1 hypothetical protein Metfor_1533 [Methanoregula formicica SMSP]